MRVAPPPPPARTRPRTRCRRRTRGPRRASRTRRWRSGFPANARRHSLADSTRPSNEMKAGEWNTIDIVLDANILRPFLNDAGGISGGVAEEEYGRSGAIALFAGRNRAKRGSRTSLTRTCSREWRDRGRVAPVPDEGAQRVLLLVGSRRRRHQQGRRSRHRGRAVLLPRARLQRRARDLHGRHHRRGHQVLQRRAVHLRLHRRRLAGRDQFALHTAHAPLCESARRVPPLGHVHGDGPHHQRARADEGRQRRRQAGVRLQGRQQPVRLRQPRPRESHRHVAHARDQHTRSVGESRHGRGRRQRRRPGRFRERVWLVGGTAEGEHRDLDLPPWRVRKVEPLEPWRGGDRRVRRQRRRAERSRQQPAGARLGAVLVRAEESGRRLPSASSSTRSWGTSRRRMPAA